MPHKSQQNGYNQAMLELWLQFLQRSRQEMRREAPILRLMGAYHKLRFSLT
jgi:hypothetical protein